MSPNQLATIAKSQVTTGTSAVNSNDKKSKPETTRVLPTIATKILVMVKQTPKTKFPTIPTPTIQRIKKTEHLDFSTHPVVKLNIPQRDVTLEQTQQTDRLLGTDGRKDKTKSSGEKLKASRMRMCRLQPKLETPRLHSGTACDWPETTKIPKPLPIPEVVWQQPSETSTNKGNLNNTNIDSTIHYTQETSQTTVSSQTSPPKGTPIQNCVVTTEHPPGIQTGNEPVPFFNCSKNSPTHIQNSEQHVTTTLTGDTTIIPLTNTTPLIEEGLVRDQQTNEFYLH